jgi:hypothetical protein
MMMFTSLFLCLVASARARTTPAPRPFPPRASYTAHLVTTNQSQLCQFCTFAGRHAINADAGKEFIQ